jgi:transposase
MVGAEVVAAGRRVRRFRSVSEKRRIAELTFEPGASVALVARAYGVNANQVFKWRRALKRGELNEASVASRAMLPVSLSGSHEITGELREADAQAPPPVVGAIHIELPGRARISVESGADPVLLRLIFESLRK